MWPSWKSPPPAKRSTFSRENLLSKKARAAFDQRRQVPSAGQYQHDDRSANQIHFADEVPSSFGGNPYQGDETRKNQADGALGQNGERDCDVEKHPPLRESFGHQNEFEERHLHEEGQRHIDARSGAGLQILKSGGEDERGEERGHVVEQAAHVEVTNDDAGDGEAG